MSPLDSRSVRRDRSAGPWGATASRAVSPIVAGLSERECGNAVRGQPPEDDSRRPVLQGHVLARAGREEDLVRGFVAGLIEGGEEWVVRLDFSTLEPLPTERIDSNLRSRSNDLVWRVRFRDAEDGP